MPRAESERMGKGKASSLGMALALLGLAAAFGACSGSVKVEGDGCTTKGCLSDGGVACTFEGKSYSAGQQVSGDGCNTCTCTSSGQVQCTRSYCGDAGNECASLVSAMDALLSSVQRCDSADECGQRIPGSSCGGTRDWIARKDADLSPYLAARDRVQERGCATTGGSTCDLPAADGFACIDHVCGWNYVNVDPQPTCEQHDAGELCVRGTPTGDGEQLAVGDSLQVTVRSSGCFSSSCTKVVEASCAIGSSDDFEVKANFCVADTAVPGEGCTGDCGNVHADCSFGQPLTAGEHQVKIGSIAVGFQVPSKLPFGGLCAGSPFR